MAETENGRGKYSATSGLGWMRLDDGNYLWQPHKWTDAIIISKETFDAIGNIRVFETFFAVFTLAPVAPMTALFLKGQLSLTTFATISVCLIVLNIPVSLYSKRRMRALTRNAKPSGQRLSISYNPLHVFSDGMLKGAILIAVVTGIAALFALVSMISGTGLPPPKETLNVYNVSGMFIVAVLALYTLIRERQRRRLRR